MLAVSTDYMLWQKFNFLQHHSSANWHGQRALWQTCSSSSQNSKAGNQELEKGLRCLASQAPSLWSRQLVWDEYAHNSLPCVSSGFYAFQCVATALIQVCRCTWARAWQCLQRTSTQYKKMADCRRTKGPHYQVCQRVWLSTRGLPLRSDSRKLAPRFVGPFPVSKIVNPVAVKLRLPMTMRIHPTFHVRRIKPVVESPLVLAIPPQPRIVDGEPVYSEEAAGSSSKRLR